MPDITVGVNRDMRGGLDSDTDVNYLNGGNYPDCVNVERNNDSTGGSDTPSIGNTLEYILPEIQKQSQKVRIFNSLSDLENQQYNFIRMSLYNNNGFLIKNSYLVDTSYDIKTFNGIKNAVQAVLGSTIWVDLANGSVTGVSNTLNNILAQDFFDVLFDFEYDSYVFQLVPGFGDLTLITSGGGGIGGGIIGGGNDGKRVINDIPGRITGGEFAVNNNSSVGTRIVDSFTEFNPLKTRIIEEAYSASAAGKPHLIGSKENNSKLFMCWTTKTQEQSKIETVGGVDMYINTSTLGAGSGKLWIQTNITPHGLIDYQSIILANASEPFSIYNGTWL